MSESEPLRVLILNHGWLKQELEACGIEVRTAGWQVGASFDFKFDWGFTVSELEEMMSGVFDPDVILFYDNSALPGLLDFETWKRPKILFSVDTHHHHHWHLDFATCFNRVLVAQKPYLDYFVHTPQEELLWFPLWPTGVHQRAEVQDIEVGFRGTLSKRLHPERVTFFEQVAEKIPVDFGEGPYAECYTRSKIVLNQNVSNDLNFRVFEAMMCGSMLMTPSSSTGIEDLFVDGEDLVLYEDGNVEEVIQKLEYYLSHSEERERIAKSGHAKLLKNHSPEAVARKLKHHLESVAKEEPRSDEISSFKVQVLSVQSLWQFVRRDNDISAVGPLQQAINYADTLMQKIPSDIQDTGDNFEACLVLLDTVCSDLIEESEYLDWKKDLVNKFSMYPYVQAISLASSDNEAADEARQILVNTRRDLAERLLKPRDA